MSLSEGAGEPGPAWIVEIRGLSERKGRALDRLCASVGSDENASASGVPSDRFLLLLLSRGLACEMVDALNVASEADEGARPLAEDFNEDLAMMGDPGDPGDLGVLIVDQVHPWSFERNSFRYTAMPFTKVEARSLAARIGQKWPVADTIVWSERSIFGLSADRETAEMLVSAIEYVQDPTPQLERLKASIAEWLDFNREAALVSTP